MPVSVTPTLAPREADDTAVCARASLAGLSGHEYRPNQRLPRLVTAGVASAMDPRWGSGAAVGRRRHHRIFLTSPSRFHLRWTRASLVVLALLALIFAPGTRFAAATEPDSDLVPVRGFRRLTQTTNDGGVEHFYTAIGKPGAYGGDLLLKCYHGSLTTFTDTLPYSDPDRANSGFDPGEPYSDFAVTCCNNEVDNTGSRPGCLSAKTHQQAVDHCASNGKVLCSADQISNGAGSSTGCGFDFYRNWLRDPCVCDASAPIANGDVGNCTSVLMHGESCTPTCDTGYGLMGGRSCVDGTTVDTAACAEYLQRAKLTAGDGAASDHFGTASRSTATRW